jgi:flagellin
MSALATLNNTQQELKVVQERISSGLKVSNASDNAAYWSISTTMQSDNKVLGAVTDALNLGASTVEVANSALTSTVKLLNQFKTDLVTAQEPGVDRAKIQTDISALQSQMKTIADAASFSGQNWLSFDSTATGFNGTKTIVSSFSRNGANVSIGTIDVDITKIALYDSGGSDGILNKSRTQGTTTGSIDTIDVSTLTDSTADQTKLADYSQMVDTALQELTTASANLGADKTRIALQQSFISNLSDAITKGTGALVDADMNQESTKLQALQVQQQLGIQSLSIANQNSQMILKLFGG